MRKILLIALVAAAVLTGCNRNKTAQARYSGRDMSGRVEIIKDVTTKTTSIKVDMNTSWQLYAGESTEEVDFSRTVADGETGGTATVNAPFSPRQYFQLTTPDGKAILAERHLPLQGGHNYRDVGGYRTEDGHYVKWGKVFRTDDMHNLTDADLQYLAALPLRTVVDFRSAQEISEAADRLPASVTHHAQLSISPGNLTDVRDFSDIDEAAAAGFMMQINRSFSTDSLIMAQYREFFRLLQDETNLPLSFHCTAGKDRTGMGAALFLSSLGVGEDVIMEDYLLSNKYLAAKYGTLIEQYPALRPMFTVDASYLGAGLDQIKENFGSVEKFLTGQLGVDIAKMKKIYLYR